MKADNNGEKLLQTIKTTTNRSMIAKIMTYRFVERVAIRA